MEELIQGMNITRRLDRIQKTITKSIEAEIDY